MFLKEPVLLLFRSENMDIVISTEEAILKIEEEIFDSCPYTRSGRDIHAFCTKKRIFLEMSGEVAMSTKDGSGELKDENLQKFFQKIKVLK